MHTRLALVAFLFTGFAALAAHAEPAAQPEAKPATTSTADSNDVGALIRFPVEKYQLPNGLTVLLHEDHSTPIVSYQTWFRVGSKYEQPGTTGIAHLFEHLMFKGAKRYTGAQLDEVLQANGATNNAFTTQDYTGYYENLPSAKLELAIDIDSDRMQNLQLTPENLKAEREVVKEERRMRVDNNPMGLLREALFATQFRVHPYRWPVIGYMQDLDNISVEKATEFYRTYYAPNNATIVVAGDFVSADAKRMIEKYYGQIPSQTIPDAKIAPEPQQSAPRSQVLTHEVQSTQFAIAYQSPKSGTDESYAMDLLANIMGNGMSSRLYQRLVYKDQTATSVVAANMTLQDAGSFQIYVSMKPGQDFAKAERAVIAEMWRPRNLGIKPEELQKAKNQVMKAYVDSLKTVHGKGEVLALNETVFRNYEEIFKDLGRYEKVTPQDLRAVATKYLNPNQVIRVVMKPTPAARGKSHAPASAAANGGAQ